MKAKPKSIVLCKQFENSRNVLFLMSHDDYRFGTDNYAPVTSGKLTATRMTADNGHRTQLFVADNGEQYMIFSDWSARKI